MSEAIAQNRDSGTLAKGSLAAAVLAAIAFFGLGFALEGWWFVIGLVLGAIAVVLGVVARRRPLATSDQRLALIGLILGAIIVAWFVLYIVIDAIF